MSIPVATADDDFPAGKNEQRLVKRGAREVVLKDDRAQSVLEQLLLFFAASERGQGIQVVRLVHPHVEAQLAIDPGCRNQPLVDELGLDDGLPLNQGELSLLDLSQDEGLVVLLLILFLVDGPVHLQIHELIAHQVVFENIFAVFLRGMLLRGSGLRNNNVRGALPVVVHLQLVGLGKVGIALAELLEVDSVLVGDA